MKKASLVLIGLAFASAAFAKGPCQSQAEDKALEVSADEGEMRVLGSECIDAPADRVAYQVDLGEIDDEDGDTVSLSYRVTMQESSCKVTSVQKIGE